MHTLVVDARFCPEVAERVLRVTRHRGFQVWA
ncbi:MAG: acetolactate synthase 2 small subunit, partial [Plesiomonas shigelloides]